MHTFPCLDTLDTLQLGYFVVMKLIAEARSVDFE